MVVRKKAFSTENREKNGLKGKRKRGKIDFLSGRTPMKIV